MTGAGRVLFILMFLCLQQEQWVEYAGAESSETGTELYLVLQLRITDGYHIQDIAPEDPNLVATKLKLDLPGNWVLIKVEFPASEELLLDGTTEVLQVFSETVIVRVVIDTHGEFSSAGHIPAILSYQACDNKKCYFPRELKFTITL